MRVASHSPSRLFTVDDNIQQKNKDVLCAQSKAVQSNYRLPAHLSLPDAKVLRVNGPEKRKYSFSVSENSKDSSGSLLDRSRTNVHVNLDVEIINKDDYEYFDPQDEIQVAKNAVERLKLITGSQFNYGKHKPLLGSKSTSAIQKNVQEEQAGGLTERDLFNETEFYSPLHKKLRKELLETREKLAETKALLEASEKRNIKIVSKYNKEEVDRTVHSKILSLPYPEQAEILRSQIESKFYNAVDGLDPKVVEILNQKLSSVKDFFMKQVRLIQHYNDELREKVDMMESMNKDGMKFADMETEKLIERIGMIEDLRRESKTKLRQIDPSSRTKANMNRPQQIWNMLMSSFGADYFLEVIEEEYGIAPGANEYFAK